jgi:maleylpyruvate isomerase
MEVMTTRNDDRELATGLLGEASSRLVRTVDGFGEGDWSAPSLLPGWTRAHVVAHLALNAEGIARALGGLVADAGDHEPATMYDSDERRDSDIVELAGSDPTHLRDRLLAGTTSLTDAIAAIPDESWETRLERTPGGRRIRADSFPGMRLREIEIHHADLGASYTRADWSPVIAANLLDAMTRRDPGDAGGFEIRPLDLDRTWLFGDGEAEYPVPVVTGPACDIAWWLTGRPTPETLSCSHGELPRIQGW